MVHCKRTKSVQNRLSTVCCDNIASEIAQSPILCHTSNDKRSNPMINAAINDEMAIIIVWNAFDDYEGRIVLSWAAAAIANRDFECGHLEGDPLGRIMVVSVQKSWDARY